MTIVWHVDPNDIEPADGWPGLAEAGRLLAAGETVAFPTETVYGLGADATNTAAVEAVFQAKGRPSDNPLIVHIADWAQLDGLVAEVSDTARRLMARFWPGPLTLVLPVRPGAVSPRVTAGLDTVAVRMPAHPVALALIRAAGCPVAAPSANRSGRPSPTLAAHVREDLDGRIAGLVDAGPTGVGLESTVAEVIGDSVHVLRPGGVTAAEMQAALPDCTVVSGGSHAGEADGRTTTGDGVEPPSAAAAAADAADALAYVPKSPGIKYTHYAPKGVLTIVRPSITVSSASALGDSDPDPDPDPLCGWVQKQIRAARQQGERTGVLTTRSRAPLYDADLVIGCGDADDLEAAAHGLYAALRDFDEAGIARMWAEAYPEGGLGEAIMNRLLKAAGGRIVGLSSQS
ncbi:L-threonylcarbamoyladenylate synthase [Paenibacillus koleovorans]|uniref:L-threonylcarbamoyladenylate synthase n=1 Tax=Paenibacillus koleovorans TaxID=121608 RepID=UPI000FD8A460|nr:L-threonylcarbamoyladenylate synthase [Paenibacillus koleovorans]